MSGTNGSVSLHRIGTKDGLAPGTREAETFQGGQQRCPGSFPPRLFSLRALTNAPYLLKCGQYLQHTITKGAYV